jgi:hypothetical protein
VLEGNSSPAGTRSRAPKEWYFNNVPPYYEEFVVLDYAKYRDKFKEWLAKKQKASTWQNYIGIPDSGG